jgi:hypothetical protein
MIRVIDKVGEYLSHVIDTLPMKDILALLNAGVISGNPCWAESHGSKRMVKDILDMNPKLKLNSTVKLLLNSFGLNITHDDRLEKKDFSMYEWSKMRTNMCAELNIRPEDFTKYNFAVRFSTRCQYGIELLRNYVE